VVGRARSWRGEAREGAMWEEDWRRAGMNIVTFDSLLIMIYIILCPDRHARLMKYIRLIEYHSLPAFIAINGRSD
jgi:hypothetical protein